MLRRMEVNGEEDGGVWGGGWRRMGRRWRCMRRWMDVYEEEEMCKEMEVFRICWYDKEVDGIVWGGGLRHTRRRRRR